MHQRHHLQKNNAIKKNNTKQNLFIQNLPSQKRLNMPNKKINKKNSAHRQAKTDMKNKTRIKRNSKENAQKKIEKTKDFKSAKKYRKTRARHNKSPQKTRLKINQNKVAKGKN